MKQVFRITVTEGQAAALDAVALMRRRAGKTANRSTVARQGIDRQIAREADEDPRVRDHLEIIGWLGGRAPYGGGGAEGGS